MTAATRMTLPGPALPVDEVLHDLAASLEAGTSAVLVAPPGAGKTTRVPLALLGTPWLANRKLILVEPRRLAARAAAERMAELLGEKVGETVGLKMRLASEAGPRTRILVVTEGVATRLILDDPALEGIGAILFDEYHERSLDADLALALALDARAALRQDLRILAMSATLDDRRIATLLGDAPVIRSEGRMFPVETRHIARNQADRMEAAMADVIVRATREETGSVLAFLPGVAEIRRTAERLAERLDGTRFEIVPLHGGLDLAAQRRAIAPARGERRRIVLATSIAETSITVDGVRIVVDSGLARVPRYEPDAGVTRLDTVRVSRASADQRRGRAGRTEPGVCFRLWSEPETAALLPFAEPEIRSADLSGLLLDCAAWGTPDPASLAWLDPPTPAQVSAAREVLGSLDAVDPDGGITGVGRRLRSLPLEPRLAHMVIAGAERGAAREAAEIAALLSERGLGGNDTELEHRLEAFRRDRGERASRMRALARDWARLAERLVGKPVSRTEVPSPAVLLAAAYPDRIAKARGAPGQFLLVNGRAGALEPTDALARMPFLVVAELAGAAARMRIGLAAALPLEELEALAASRITTREDVEFEIGTRALRARRQRRLGAIVIEATPAPLAPSPENAALLADGAARAGIDQLAWTKAQKQLRDRVGFLRASGAGEGLPDLSTDALSATVRTWLAPFVVGRTRLADIGADDLQAALDALVPWSERRRIDDAVPTHYEAPTGNRHPIDYEGEGAPILAIRVQELFGLGQHPSIAGGRLPLTLHLLSPAHRPIQITRDLPGFWKGSWADVRAEMRGRYPRHPWPDDPATAVPTARAKPRAR